MRTPLIALMVVLGLLGTSQDDLAAATATPGTGVEPTTDVVVALRGAEIPDARLTSARLRKARHAVTREAHALGVQPDDVFTSTSRGFSARVTERQRTRLERDPRVLSVSDDEVLSDETMVEDDQVDTSASDGTLAETTDLERSRSKVVGRPVRERLEHQITPTWLKRIGVKAVDKRIGSGRHRRGFDADIAIIDSGVSRTHPDVRPVGGKDCTHSGGWGDGYGHGLGVASVLGARDNDRGIVGILPGVRLWSVRVFDKTGHSKLSWVLCGLDWVASRRDPRHRHRPLFEGATLSFSIGDTSRKLVQDRDCGRRTGDLIHRAICRIANQGTILVAAAGNYGDRAGIRRPAGFREVITVSAMADFDGKPGGKGSQSSACRPGSALEWDDQFATFSSFGAGVDLIAPGKCIWVAFRGRSYARVSGTSFSTPMVLGAALRYLRRYPRAQPNQVRQALIHAGRRDWRTGSDPDHSHEPRVDVRHFAPPPTFTFHQSSRRTLHQGRKGVTVTMRAHRRYGHTARIKLHKARAPRGVKVTIKGSKVTIRAAASARRGEQSVLIRASDGEVRRTVRIPIRVRPARR